VAGLRPGFGRGWSVHSFVIEFVLSGVVAAEAEVGSDVAFCRFATVEMEDLERVAFAEMGSSCGGVGG